MVHAQDGGGEFGDQAQFVHGPAQRVRVLRGSRQKRERGVDHQQVKAISVNLEQMVDKSPPVATPERPKQRAMELELHAEVERRPTQGPERVALLGTEHRPPRTHRPAEQRAARAAADRAAGSRASSCRTSRERTES